MLSTMAFTAHALALRALWLRCCHHCVPTGPALFQYLLGALDQPHGWCHLCLDRHIAYGPGVCHACQGVTLLHRFGTAGHGRRSLFPVQGYRESRCPCGGCDQQPQPFYLDRSGDSTPGRAGDLAHFPGYVRDRVGYHPVVDERTLCGVSPSAPRLPLSLCLLLRFCGHHSQAWPQPRAAHVWVCHQCHQRRSSPIPPTS